MSAEPTAAVAARVDALATAVLACPSVAGLHGGHHGHAATYLPRRRVPGIVLTPEEVAVHVVGRYPATAADIATQVRAAVTPIVGGAPIAVSVEDLAVGEAASTTAVSKEEQS